MAIISLLFFFCLSTIVTSQNHVLNIRDKGKICSAWFTAQSGVPISYNHNQECISQISSEYNNATKQYRLCCTGMSLTTPSANFPRECGRQKHVPHKNRIIGGFVANPNSWPWQVLLRGTNNQCGGTLIDRQHVLTAAHCFQFPVQVPNYKVYVGAHAVDKPMYMEQEITAKQIWTHEGYNPNSVVNDIAIIRLSRPVQISDTVNFICLPGMEVGTVVNHTLWTSGWGRTVHLGAASPILKQTWLHTMGSRCNVYGAAQFNHEKQICAGRYAADSSSCQGDSGGPLMIESPNGQWFINGVVSYGSSVCGTDGNPGVYTRVKFYLPWIESKVKSA